MAVYAKLSSTLLNWISTFLMVMPLFYIFVITLFKVDFKLVSVVCLFGISHSVRTIIIASIFIIFIFFNYWWQR